MFNLLMGFFRGSLLVLVSVVLIIAFLAMNFSLTLNLSLKYNNVEKEAGDSIVNFIKEDSNVFGVLESKLPEMNSFCESGLEEKYVFVEDGYTLSIPCSSIYQGSEEVIRAGSQSLIQEVYYKDYTCSFLKCLKEEGTPFFLVSEKSKDYWEGKFVFFLTISLVLMALVLILCESKYNAFILSGVLLSLSSLPFIKFKGFFSSVDSTILTFFNILFSRSKDVFAIMILIGIVLIVIGIIMKLFFTGFKIHQWFENLRMKDKISSMEKNSTFQDKIFNKEVKPKKISKK